MKGHLVIIIIIVAVVLILGGVGYSLLNRPSPTKPPPQAIPPTEQPAPTGDSKPSPVQAPPEQPPPPTFEEKIESLEQAITDVCTTGKSKEVTLVFSETEVNDQATKSAPNHLTRIWS